jgi:hypothetical protein
MLNRGCFYFLGASKFVSTPTIALNLRGLPRDPLRIEGGGEIFLT